VVGLIMDIEALLALLLACRPNCLRVRMT